MGVIYVLMSTRDLPIKYSQYLCCGQNTKNFYSTKILILGSSHRFPCFSSLSGQMFAWRPSLEIESRIIIKKSLAFTVTRRVCASLAGSDLLLCIYSALVKRPIEPKHWVLMSLQRLVYKRKSSGEKFNDVRLGLSTIIVKCLIKPSFWHVCWGIWLDGLRQRTQH